MILKHHKVLEALQYYQDNLMKCQSDHITLALKKESFSESPSAWGQSLNSLPWYPKPSESVHCLPFWLHLLLLSCPVPILQPGQVAQWPQMALWFPTDICIHKLCAVSPDQLISLSLHCMCSPGASPSLQIQVFTHTELAVLWANPLSVRTEHWQSNRNAGCFSGGLELLRCSPAERDTATAQENKIPNQWVN